MTVSDYLKQTPAFQTPVYFHSPAGPLRVIGVIARGRCLPFVRCVTSRGAIVEWAALYSTELDEDVCPDCGGTREVPTDDPLAPHGMATCPDCAGDDELIYNQRA